MKNNTKQLSYIEGIEDGINWIGKEMKGSAKVVFDLHASFIFDYCKDLKDKLNKNDN